MFGLMHGSIYRFQILSQRLTVKIKVKFVGFGVLTAVVMNVAIFWDIAPCSPYVNRRFGETYHLHIQGRKTAAKGTSEQQMASQKATQTSRRYIPEDGSI
jgi:hypothetical protein